MKKRSWIYAGVGAALAAAALGWAFAPRPVEVEVASVTQGRFETAIEEDGKTRLRDRYVVAAPLAGVLSRIALREGGAVEAGAVVATLTPALSPLLDERTRRELQIRVETAQAQVDRTRAQIDVAEVALAKSRSEIARSEQLARAGFVSSMKLDNDRLAVLGAQKEVEAARQARRVAAQEVEQARAALAAVQQPGSSRAFALRAPVGGRVLRVAHTSETPVAVSAPLLEIGDTRRLEVVAELLTSDALQARPGSRVLIERWGGPALEGRVRLVEPAGYTKVSALGVEEQRVEVLIDIEGDAEGHVEQRHSLGDGYRVGVRIVTLTVDDALRVPVGAVFPLPGNGRDDGEGDDRAGGMAVFTLREGRARLAPVQVAARNGSYAWIRAGLAAGAAVIVYPPPAVADGVRVKVRKV